MSESPAPVSGLAQLRSVLRFELAFRRRHPPLWIFTALAVVLSFLLMAFKDSAEIFGGGGTIALNAPVAIFRLLTIASILLGFVITTAFVSASVNRDQDFGIQGLFFATPLRKAPYLLGRFFGSLLAACFVTTGVALGGLLATLMPWHEAERLVSTSLTPYAYTLGVFVYPNLLFIGAISFAVATLTRRNMFAYVALLGLMVAYSVSGNYIADLDNDFLAAVADPFGLRAYGLATRYWTPTELNSLAAPFTTEIIVNRIVWVGAGLGILAFALLRYRMSLAQGKKGTKDSKPDTPAPRSDVQLPALTPSYGLSAQLAALRVQARLELRGLLFSAPFIVVALFGVFNIVGAAGGFIRQGGTTTLPVTNIMLEVVQGGMSLFMLIVLIFYAGELIHRERKHGMAQLYDTLPMPNWIPLIAKLAAMIVAMIVLLIVAGLTTIGFQLSKGYTGIELGLYVRDISFVQLQGWIVLGVGAVVAQVLVNNKFFGYGVMALWFLSNVALGALHFEHNLYSFGGFPGVTYSDMNGYGHYVEGRAAFTFYWFAVAGLLVLIAELFWVRGTDNPLRRRIQLARARLNPSRSFAIIATGLLWLGSGAFIIYNTTVLNPYIPSDVQEDMQARYERDYKQYEGLPHPRIQDVELDAELYPHERRVVVRGRLKLANKSGEVIEQIHIPSFDTEVEVVKLELPGGTQTHFDEELGYRIFTLDPPWQPGAEFEVNYEYSKHLRGFGNSVNDNAIVENGTFFNSVAFMPHFGYTDGLELQDPNTRKEQGLPERPRMAKIDDQEARKNTYISSDSDWVGFAATISTSPEQIAVAPGYLIKEWEEGGRRYFRYEMDAPILNFWSILSAKYTVSRDSWTPEGGGEPVAIEIYYHDVHDTNVPKMIEAIKGSLDYFTVAFSPYQHRQVRILEFPKYASFAQSFPNTIPYSESIGFIADASDPDDVDYVYYVTSHEVAHQWWAHQVIGANVQGGTLMSESLSQYSALMVMKARYGEEAMPKFLRYELDRYLNSRSGERIGERPLLLVENQQYIHYRKASVVFYALSEYIGEPALNQALSDYIAQVGFQDPPYTISYDLYAHLKKATPDKYAYLLEDMFEKITLYDNRAKGVTVRELDDGRFEVTLELQVKKLYADEKGIETEAETMADWIEIGVFGEKGEDAGEDELGEPLYLELHQLDGSETELSVIVDERPATAGIDPRNLLIDREPDDNNKAVEDAA